MHRLGETHAGGCHFPPPLEYNEITFKRGDGLGVPPADAYLSLQLDSFLLNACRISFDASEDQKYCQDKHTADPEPSKHSKSLENPKMYPLKPN